MFSLRIFPGFRSAASGLRLLLSDDANMPFRQSRTSRAPASALSRLDVGNELAVPELTEDEEITIIEADRGSGE